MKKVSNHKSYNTETAEKIASWNNNLYQTDFNYRSEDLFRTAKGNWFLYGEGGANSVYSKSYGNNSSGSSDIISLSGADALSWLENHDEVDIIEEYFMNEIEEA